MSRYGSRSAGAGSLGACVRSHPARHSRGVPAPIYERVAVETPGMFARSSTWWQARTLDDPEWRRGPNGDLQCAVLENGGRPTAYALYGMNSWVERRLQAGSVAVIEAIGDSPEATCAIWRYLLDIDWMARSPLIIIGLATGRTAALGAQAPSDKQQGVVLPPTASLSPCASRTARHYRQNRALSRSSVMDDASNSCSSST
jgi:Acetyltransferase (GNAT) domain